MLFAFTLLISTHCFGQEKQQVKLDSIKQKTILQNVFKVIADNYVYPDRGTAMINNLKKQSEIGKYKDNTNPNDFAAVLTRDIKEIYNDRHIRINYDPKLENDIVAFTSSKKGADQVNYNDSLKDLEQNFYFRKVEILPSNIGYVEFTNFAKPNVSASKTVNAVMQFVSHTDALIIDLRNNFGGNSLMANEILSYFFRTNTYLGRSFNKIENKWIEKFSASYKIGVRKKPLIFDYKKGVTHFNIKFPNTKYISCVFPNWDNSARSGKKSLIFKNANPTDWQHHLQIAAEELLKNRHNPQFVIIKSWNEWAEGNHLEPDAKYGLGWLKAVKKVKEQLNKNI